MSGCRSSITSSAPPSGKSASPMRCSAPVLRISPRPCRSSSRAGCASGSGSPGHSWWPAVLLMDEPLSALDAQTRDLLMEDFLELLLRERIAGLYVTHNFHEALRLADRIVVLSRRPGRIKEVIEVSIPQRERTEKSAQAKLADLGNRLWSLIRDEASVADREVIHE